MPVFSITAHACGSTVAVWKIEEPEDLLQQQCALEPAELEALARIASPARRKERLAIRALLRSMPGTAARLGYHDSGRPFLRHSTENISITHTAQFAAIIRHPSLGVGIDIERLERDFSAVEKRALSDEERADLSGTHRNTQLCLLWCAKEALYKRFSEPGADFSTQMRIHRFSPGRKGDLDAVYISRTGIRTALTLHYEIIENHALVWVAGP
jgi:4'-phosphopantetheinyl transferase EntD